MSPSRIFYVVGIVCFAVAAIPISQPVNMTALGLVFFSLGHMAG